MPPFLSSLALLHGSYAFLHGEEVCGQECILLVLDEDWFRKILVTEL